MGNSRFRRYQLRMGLFSFLCALKFICVIGATPAAQGGITIFGRVVLPDGQPANRAHVRVEMASGFNREVITDDQGRYEMRGIVAGRYQLFATNPDAPEQFSERAETDNTRAYANRLQVDLYLRLPMHSEKPKLKPGTVNATVAAQEIPKAARKAYDQGMKLQKENRVQEALSQFNQALNLYPEYFQALTERANLFMQQNKLAEAEADFERSLQLNSKYVPALRGLGYCQIQQKQYEAAVSNLERAFVMEPQVPLTLMLLGYANLSLARYEPAKQCLEEALKLGPESAARAHVYLAEVFAYEQKFKEAADSIRRYLTLNPVAGDAKRLKELEDQWRAQAKATQKHF